VDTTKTLDTHYSVAGEGAAAGGTVTFLIEDGEPQTGETLIIYGNPALTQTVDYISGGVFPAETHEQAMDLLTLQGIRTREIADRSLSLTDSSTDGSGEYDANSNRIKSLGTPTATTDATTKTYVDALVNNTALGPAPTGLIATGSTTSRTLADRWGERLNVKDFGAVGNGVTDDTAAIQAAVNAAAGSVLTVPEGTYLIGAVVIGNGVTVQGQGSLTTTFLAKTAIGQNNMFYASGVDGISFTDCGFNMQNDVVVGAVLTDSYLENIMTFVSCTDVNVSRCLLQKFINHGIMFNASSVAYTEDVTITENRFESGCKGAVYIARYGRNITVTNNRLVDVSVHALSGATNHKSIAIVGTTGAWIENNYVTQSVSGGGTIVVEIAETPSSKCFIRGNTVDGVSENGIKVGSASDIHVTGNTVSNSGVMGIYIEGSTNTLVINNTITNSNANALRVYESGEGDTNKNITVTGNIMRNSNILGATLGVPGVSAGSDNAYHIAVRQTEYINIMNNTFIDDGASSSSGIWMQGQLYLIEGNNFLQLKAGSLTLYNTATTPGTAYRISNNAGMRTEGSGRALMLAGTNAIAADMADIVVNSSAPCIMHVTATGAFTGSVAYLTPALTGTGAFSIYAYDSSNVLANTSTDLSVSWTYEVTQAIGALGMTDH